MKRLTFFVVLVVLVVFSGCGKSRPEGMPPLVSCTVTVKDGSQPIGDIHIGLRSPDAHGGWGIGGRTNASGVAKIMTIFASFEGTGVPTGTYQVVLSEIIDLPQELQPSADNFMAAGSPVNLREQTAQAAKVEAYIEANRKIPAILCGSRSPLEMIVSESGGTLEIDVANYR